jgi:hypothetical protein
MADTPKTKMASARRDARLIENTRQVIERSRQLLRDTDPLVAHLSQPAEQPKPRECT